MAVFGRTGSRGGGRSRATKFDPLYDLGLTAPKRVPSVIAQERSDMPPPRTEPEIEWHIDSSSSLKLPDHLIGKGSGDVYIGGGSNVTIRRLSMIGPDHRVEIGANCLIRTAAIALRGQGQVLKIGNNFQCSGPILNAYGADLIIGDDVLLSSKISIRTHDMHHILDAKTGEVVNPPAPVIIEDHVWIGEAVKIMPGVRIGRDSIIGIGSIVTRDVPAGSVVGGVPAKVLRSGVTWRH